MSRRLRQPSFLLAGAFFCASSVFGQVEPNLEPSIEPGVEQRRIREIRIDVAPIYTQEQASGSSWRTFTNSHKTPTRESVIRTEMLLEEGDVLDEELLAASERSLRRFKFLNGADIVVVPVDDQTVDVEVRSKEVWTLEPGVNFEGGGGLTDISAHLIEFSLFGTGRKVYVEATHESDVGTTTKFGYSDYQMFNTRWVGNTTYRTGPLVEAFFAQARLPLYSPDSIWAYGGSVSKVDEIARLFEDGEESSRHQKDKLSLNGSATRSFGERYKKTNLKVGLKYLKIDYSTLGAETTTPPPVDQANLTPSISLSSGHSEWAKNTHINKMGITEDYWIGSRYGATVGYGIPLEDSLELWKVTTYVTKSMAFENRQRLNLSASVNSEIVRNTYLILSAKYYKNFSGHTLAMRVKTNIGYDLDSSKQFQLGADSGLRGYPARQFTGQKLMLINIEDRQFWGDFSLGPKVALGSVVFLDAGNVWKDDEDIALDDLNWSAGVGLRLGLSNMPSQPILRLDLGWAIAGNDGFEVTVGMEQHF
jgi:outer membrane protein assembly factor BamA